MDSRLNSVFDKELLQHAVNDRGAKSKIATESGELFIHGLEEQINSIFSASATHAKLQRGETTEQLGKVWRIPLDETKQTLDVTPQLNKQDGNSNLSSQFSTNDQMLRYKRITYLFYTGTFFIKVKSKRGFTMMQLFVSNTGFVKVYGMKTIEDIPDAV